MRKLLFIVGGLAWFALVYSVTWWMTFPSEAFAGATAPCGSTGGVVASVDEDDDEDEGSRKRFVKKYD